MPLTSKGNKILSAMQKQYGSKKGKSVFYASINAGKIKGAEGRAGGGKTPLPKDVVYAEGGRTKEQEELVAAAAALESPSYIKVLERMAKINRPPQKAVGGVMMDNPIFSRFQSTMQRHPLFALLSRLRGQGQGRFGQMPSQAQGMPQGNPQPPPMGGGMFPGIPQDQGMAQMHPLLGLGKGSGMRAPAAPAAPAVAAAQPEQPHQATAQGGSVFSNLDALYRPITRSPKRNHLQNIQPAQGMASGGKPGGYTNLSPPWYARHAMKGLGMRGLLNSKVAGRTDRLPLDVTPGSYVVPADVVSALGQGNTMAGGNILGKMFKGAKMRPQGFGMATGGGVKMFSGTHENKYGGGHFRRKGVPGMTRSQFEYAEGGKTQSPFRSTISGYDWGEKDARDIGHKVLKTLGEKGRPYLAERQAAEAREIQDAVRNKKYQYYEGSYADGGEAPEENVPIIAAGGEYIIPPEAVVEVGKGNMDKGHDVLDKFIANVRRQHIRTLKKLPPPKAD